eukprot:g33743.t1
MNAALQCLSHSHGMQKYFRHCPHAFSSKAQGPRQKLLMAFAHWFEQDWGHLESAPYHRPEDVLRAVQQLNPTREVKEEVEDESHSGENGNACHDARSDRRSAGNTASTDFLPSGGKVLERSSSGSSTSQHLMQFCQVPESNTDMGEIRLSETSAGNRPFAVFESFGSAALVVRGRPVAESAEEVEQASSGPNMASAGESSEGGAASSKKIHRTHFESIISELFQGKVVSCVRCTQCNQTSRRWDGTIYFRISHAFCDADQWTVQKQVPIPNANEPASPLSADGSPVSLPAGSPGHLQPQSAGLRSSSWSGVLGGLGKVKSWFYDKGLPEILCIHLKRFRFDNAYGWFAGSKNSRVVNFPVTSHLDMSQFMEEVPNQPTEYRLIGLIQHIGSMGGGHYIAYCQHKRKPQDWYEFDDVQVNPVMPEQVERAEPYVLFYQRVPSKKAKHDRQIFKNDMRAMQENLNRSGREKAALEMNRQALQEEIRNHGPALRNLYKSPPAELEVAFVSKHWYVRLTTMSEPGPLDNKEYLCPHGQLGYSSAELASEPFFPISKQLSKSLIGIYGGGPEITSLDNCKKCQIRIAAYNLRKQAEYEMVTRYDTKENSWWMGVVTPETTPETLGFLSQETKPGGSEPFASKAAQP